jgi:beta-glucosidase
LTSGPRLPDGFLWGVTTASYQVEGAVNEGGRGPSIWDTFSHTPGKTTNGDTGDVASQHYHRVDEDLALIADLGVSAYRFSVAWPRVQPEGKGPANQTGLDFYRRLVGKLRAQGTLPVATLYHWDLPQALEDAGGWPVRETAERYADYVLLVADALGDEVAMWVTLNEPWCSAWLGYGTGQHAPGLADLRLAARATHHLLLAHALGVEALRSVGEAPVGISLNLGASNPASDHELDVAAARLADGNFVRLYLEPLLRGRYPEDVLEAYATKGAPFDAVEPGDLEAISAPLDFLGVNYYSNSLVAHESRLGEARRSGYFVPAQAAPSPLGTVQVGRPEAERTASSWEVEPQGLADVVARLHREYTALPVYITENGSAEHDYRGPDGAVHDPHRVSYIERHLRALGEARRQGADVRGYFVWSLLDNFEWAEGYSMRFGLVWVDYPTGERVPKDSYHWYKQVVATGGRGISAAFVT